MVPALLRPRLHVPAAVALVLSAMSWIVLDAFDVLRLTPSSASAATAAIAVASLFAARAVFVRAESPRAAFGAALAWPIAVAVAAGPVVGIAMTIERPDAAFSFAGQQSGSVFLVVGVTAAVGGVGSVVVAALVRLLGILRAKHAAGAHLFAAAAWGAAAASLAGAHVASRARWIEVGFVAAVVLALGQLAARAFDSRAAAAPAAGPYRGPAARD